MSCFVSGLYLNVLIPGFAGKGMDWGKAGMERKRKGNIRVGFMRDKV